MRAWSRKPSVSFSTSLVFLFHFCSLLLATTEGRSAGKQESERGGDRQELDDRTVGERRPEAGTGQQGGREWSEAGNGRCSPLPVSPTLLGPGMSEYEARRLENIRRNAEMLAQLNLQGPIVAVRLAASHTSSPPLLLGTARFSSRMAVVSYCNAHVQQNLTLPNFISWFRMWSNQIGRHRRNAACALRSGDARLCVDLRSGKPTC